MRTPQFTGTVNRIAFDKGNRDVPESLIIEVYDSTNVRTFVAYGHTARTLRGFLHVGKRYTIDYDPHSSGEFTGEAFSARDRNE